MAMHRPAQCCGVSVFLAPDTILQTYLLTYRKHQHQHHHRVLQ